MIATKNYALYNLAPKNLKYLAYQNDVGGIETAFFPMWHWTLEPTKIDSEHQIFNAVDKRDGIRTETTIQETEKHSLKSMVLPSNEMLMMRNIITRPIWLMTEDGFERVYADTKSMELPPSSKSQGQFSFSFKRYIR